MLLVGARSIDIAIVVWPTALARIGLARRIGAHDALIAHARSSMAPQILGSIGNATVIYHAVLHRTADQLALAGELALIKRTKDADRSMEASAGVADRRTRLDRTAVGLASDRHRTPRRLRNHVKGEVILIGAVVAEALDRDIDDARVDFADDVIAKAEPFDDAGGEILGKDIGLFDQPAQNGAPLVGLQIGGDALLVGVEQHEVLGIDALFVGRCAAPLVGSSTLITSAPSHPKVRVQDVPASNWVRSTTRTPLSAPRWAVVVPPMASSVRSSGIRFLLVVINHRRSRRRWRQSTLSLLLGVVNAFTLVVFSYAKWRSATSESAVDPEDDQRHIERKRKGEKRNGVKERLIADRDHRLRDLVDRHSNSEQLVVTIAGRDLNHPADVVPACDIVDKIPRTAALPVGREHPGGNWILQLGQLRQPWRGLIAMLEKRRDSGLVRICHDPPRAGEYKAEASR